VDHPYLVTHSESSALSAAAAYRNTQMALCGFCGEEPEDGVTARCGHCFCKACLLQYLNEEEGEESVAEENRDHRCPQCNDKLTVDLGRGGAGKSKRRGIMVVDQLITFESIE
jgi:DNA repair protein RAD16